MECQKDTEGKGDNGIPDERGVRETNSGRFEENGYGWRKARATQSFHFVSSLRRNDKSAEVCRKQFNVHVRLA